MKPLFASDQTTSLSSENAPQSQPRASGAAFTLPFRGRAESYQLLGLGRMDAARRLCTCPEFSPVPFGDGTQALLQLSLMKWKQSPVGPYCASFVGIVVSRESARAPTPTRRPKGPSGASVLSAFLRAPKILFVPTYAVGDVPGGPAGCAAASRAFGREVLGMEKTDAHFVMNRVSGMTHLQALEQRADGRGRSVVTGYSFSFSARRGSWPARLPISPRLLLCRELFWETAKSFFQDGVKGVFLVPDMGGLGQTVCIATRFATRPRLVDLSSDRRASFTPMVLDRPAPDGALGATLEALEFTPVVLMRDPDLDGTISGQVRSPEDALA